MIMVDWDLQRGDEGVGSGGRAVEGDDSLKSQRSPSVGP
jgi:hypothetical protein